MHKSKTREEIVSLIEQLRKLGCSSDELRRPNYVEKIKCSNGQDIECIALSEFTTVGILKQAISSLPDDAIIRVSNIDNEYDDDYQLMTFEHMVPVSDHRWKYLLSELLGKLTDTVQICYNGANKTVPRDIAIRIQILLNQSSI